MFIIRKYVLLVYGSLLIYLTFTSLFPIMNIEKVLPISGQPQIKNC